MRIEFNSETPIFYQLAEYLEKLILQGDIKEGEMLPPMRSIAADLEINHQTVLKAFRILSDRGLTEKIRGTGLKISGNARKKIIKSKQKQYLNEELPEAINKGLLLDISRKDLMKHIEKIIRENEK